MKLFHYLTIINEDENGKETYKRKQINTRAGYRLNIKEHKRAQIESIAETELSLNDENCSADEYLLLHTSPIFKQEYEYGKPKYISEQDEKNLKNFEFISLSQHTSEKKLDYRYVYCYLVGAKDIIKAQIALGFDEENNIGGISLNELKDLLSYLDETLEYNKKNNIFQTITEIFDNIILQNYIVDSMLYDMPIVILDGKENKINDENLKTLATLLEKTIKYKEYSKTRPSSGSGSLQMNLYEKF